MVSPYFEGAESIFGTGLTQFQGFRGVLGPNPENVSKIGSNSWRAPSKSAENTKNKSLTSRPFPIHNFFRRAPTPPHDSCMSEKPSSPALRIYLGSDTFAVVPERYDTYSTYFWCGTHMLVLVIVCVLLYYVYLVLPQYSSQMTHCGPACGGEKGRTREKEERKRQRERERDEKSE